MDLRCNCHLFILMFSQKTNRNSTLPGNRGGKWKKKYWQRIHFDEKASKEEEPNTQKMNQEAKKKAMLDNKKSKQQKW